MGSTCWKRLNFANNRVAQRVILQAPRIRELPNLIALLSGELAEIRRVR